MDKGILLKIMISIIKEQDIKYVNGNDWIELSSLIKEAKLSVAVGEAIYKYCPLEYQIYLDEIIFQARNNSLLYSRELKRLDHLFKSNHISYILMKGMPLSQQIYDDCFVRISSDIDLLIDVDLMKPAYSLLKNLGYRQHVYFDENSNLITIDKDCSIYGEADHEIKCIKKLNIKEFMGVEIQKATTAIPLQYIGDFKQNLVDIDVNGLTVQTTNILYSFLHLVANAYENSETVMGALRNCGIKDYFDIMIFLKNHHNKLDWDEIVNLSEKYKIKHIFHAVLINCRELFGTDLINHKLIEKFENWNYGIFCTSKGYIIDWTSTFDKRMFHEDIRIKESYEYLRHLIPKLDGCTEYQNTDNLCVKLNNTNLEIKFKWLYSEDERLVISMLNSDPKDTLFSDIYIRRIKGELKAFYCGKSNIKGIPNQLAGMTLLFHQGFYILNLNVAEFIVNGRLYFKILKQKKVINDYFIRIYLDKSYDFLNKYYSVKQENVHTGENKND